MKRYRYIAKILTVLLLFCGMANKAWADGATVTYHILTLPVDNETYHMASAFNGHRLEAVIVKEKNQTNVELPAHYKSPLATNFKYYLPADITSYSAIQTYDNNESNYEKYYDITPGHEENNVAEGTTISGTTAEYYVVYTYNSSNSIAQLDGSVRYNIDVNKKGYLAYNRGRNDRPAVVPSAKVTPEMLASSDFMKIESPGGGITTYWKDNTNNKNPESLTGSNFHFLFQFEGQDPYNIILRNAYNKDTTFIEKNEDGDKKFVYKWYKGGQFLAVSTNKAFIVSDLDKRFSQEYNSALPNPINPTYVDKPGYMHGLKANNGNISIWSTVALLNNKNNTGYVLMGTRTVNNDGSMPTPGNDNKYYYIQLGNNDLYYKTYTETEVSNSYTIGLYPIKKLTFKIVTPFYKVSASADHIISVSDSVSQYTVDNDVIETKYLPDALRRKYCSFTGKFYSDAACTHEITRFSQANYDPSEGYQVYVGYQVSASIPFKAITPASTYDATTWANATWYELTDEGSTEEYGRKLRYDGTNFKNNGKAGTYEKESEFAFIGDPYELQVVYRNATSGATAYYVGAAGTPPTTGTLLTANSSASEGYKWSIPTDAIDGSFLLEKYKGTGNWSWSAGQQSGSVTYQSALAFSTDDKDAKTITFTVSGLTDGKYIKVTTGGTDAAQIVSVTPAANNVVPVSGTSATVTVKLAANTSGASKTMTVTIQEYDDNHGDSSYGTASVITITQVATTSSFAGNTVSYNTSSSTRLKVLELPTRDYTYNIVDKAGRIAVKATVTQTVLSPLSIASIPSIIVSPFLVGETITFYTSYTDGAGRGNLSGAITYLPEGSSVSSTNIYVKYTTSAISAKPFRLSEDQEIFVKLNGQYLYYEDGAVKSSESSSNDNKYKWKLRNRDPYCMLVDNLEARTALSVAGQTEVITDYNDDGTEITPKPSRQKGAWIKLGGALPATSIGTALTFDANRDNAQRFIAKSSARAGVYEVMVATGSGVDASTTYYNIGRDNTNGTKIYNNATYRATVDEEIKFRLEENINYTYHLIDKSDHELLTAESKSPELVLPAEFQSPLVATYHFYDIDNIIKDGDTYTVKTSPTELSALTDLQATASNAVSSDQAHFDGAAADHQHIDAIDVDDINAKAKKLTSTGDHYYKIDDAYYVVNVTKACYYDIYVTYDVNDIIGFNNTGRINEYPYLLRFLQPYADGYLLENGNDALTTTEIQAIYPYCNGDGNLNIYGSAMRDEQMNGGSSTRSRWVWYFQSVNEDPYHVKIHSRNTIAYNGVDNYTYLTTYAVHFNQDTDDDAKKQHVVTGGLLPGAASAEATEYMILGIAGAYQLLTTQPIKADLNGDGDTDDDGENVRRKVTSFEQYWKTYNMIKLYLLNRTTNKFSTDTTTWVVPDSLRGELNTILTAKGMGVGSGSNQWHSYKAYANATRWNGFNDKSSGGEGKKIVEYLEHWYQTFDMGNGTFDIESADIPPVLVLLDNHGWEIMRRPLPVANYPDGDEELAALKVFDSPMVDKYYFYSQATKATGCHKYTLRMTGDQPRDAIKVNGVAYSSSSLAELPPANASGVKSSGVLNDQFVTYTVKEEYADNYDYNLTYTGNTTDGYTITSETGVSQPFLVLQNGRFYKTVNEPEKSRWSYITKPITEHTNPEGGNIYDLIVAPKNSDKINIIDGSGSFLGNNFWYVKPNMNIDKEMGIKWGAEHKGAEPMSENATKVTYKDKSGFDPYNIQLQLMNDNNGDPCGLYLTTHMVSTRIEGGLHVGSYVGTDPQGHVGTTNITLESQYTGYDPSVDRGSEGYDHTNLQMSNQTFMVVSDANGNMQLMPRFDHTLRVNVPKSQVGGEWPTTLKTPVDHAKASADNNESMGPQTTFFVRPQRFIYHIMDNDTIEALRYKRGGDNHPTITDHFKSPLATNFTYYKDAALTKQITGSFAADTIDDVENDIYVRYEYDEDADLDGDKILQGGWFTVKLANKDMQAHGTVVTTEGETQGTGVDLYTGDKPATVNADEKEWQWKFLSAPMDTASEYYRAPDPYSIKIYNRAANYSRTLAEPNPMSIGIKVPNANDGADRFALLSHPSGGYALVVAKTYTNNSDYLFLNGGSMTVPSPGEGEPAGATTTIEANFNYKTSTISDNALILLESDVVGTYTYNVINNAKKLAIRANQTHAEALGNNYLPYTPENIQSPLLNMEDYKYYGSVTKDGDDYTVVNDTKLITLYGLYDDTVYVRYDEYDVDKTSFKVPNKKTIVDSHVAREATSVDASLSIDGSLPYNIIWYNDNMMKKGDANAVSYEASQDLTGTEAYVWYFTGNDPYALKIKHKSGEYYINGGSSLVEGANNAKQFMLLRKTGYDYGILQETSGTNKLSDYGETMISGDPTKFIIFGLSVHTLIYRLIIAKSCPDSTALDIPAEQYVDIPYRPGDENTPGDLTTKRIYGSSQRDLTSVNTGEGKHIIGEKYQLGDTIKWGSTTHTYSYDAGSVSIGDDLWVPNVFYRPNCTFHYYIEGIFANDTVTSEPELDNRFKGLKVKKLISSSELIDKTVVVNLVYKFNDTLATNTGLDFVRDTAQNLWYTFESPQGATPYLAHYTNAWGLQSMPGAETRFTNDYLWTPLGDPYGFVMYNRYMLKNSDGTHKVMTMSAISEGQNLLMAEPGTGSYTAGNEIFELIRGNQTGYFRVHPMVNNSGTQFYVKRKADDYVVLSSTTSDSTDWAFGLDMTLLEPYYKRAGYVGGLNDAGKTAYEAADASGKITNIQKVVYNDANIVHYKPGYYRLHNQPNVSGISTKRYASGYLHNIEKTAESNGGGIPMHFYSKSGVSTTFAGGLSSGFKVTDATRGDIPIDSTECDPSTIFYFSGNTKVDGNPRSTMQTQGLYVAANANGDPNNGTTTDKRQRAVMSENSGSAITFSLMDIGGAVLLIHDGEAPATRRYLNFDQSVAANIYDLKYYHESPADDAKWCMQPVQKTSTQGNGEMPLTLITNNGGDDYYYATFYAPFDVLLPNDAGGKTYNAYTCRTWRTEGVNPVPVPAANTYSEGKFVPAGTPVIIRTNDESGHMTLTLPSSSPSSSLSCIFTGSYLEQKLADVDATRDVYTFGLPMTSDVNKAGDYSTSGEIVAPLPQFASTDVGFYINATPNKEKGPLANSWLRNNLYVLHNKIYYRAEPATPTPGRTATPEFVPVNFGDEDEEQPGMEKKQDSRKGDGCIYDMLGRKVATEQEVQNGTWRYRLTPGVYIIDGKKFVCSN